MHRLFASQTKLGEWLNENDFFEKSKAILYLLYIYIYFFHFAESLYLQMHILRTLLIFHADFLHCFGGSSRKHLRRVYFLVNLHDHCTKKETPLQIIYRF